MAAGIGLVSGAFQVYAIPGGFATGSLAVAFVGVLSAVTIWRPSFHKSVQRVALDVAFVKMASSSVDIRCVFSAGDELRQALEGDILNKLESPLKAGTAVRMVFRQRPPDDRAHVADNVVRIASRFATAGVAFQSKGVSWDYFMVGGVLFDDRHAAVKFYYRTRGSTAAIDHRFALVDASCGGYERMLFEALNAAFESLWSA